MPNGYTGKILRVNLTDGTMRTEEFDDAWYRTYYGGRGFNAYFLLKEVGPEVDALSPENKTLESILSQLTRSQILLIYANRCEQGQALRVANFQ